MRRILISPVLLLIIALSATAQDHRAIPFAGMLGATFVRAGIHVINDRTGEISGISIRQGENGACDLRLLIGTGRDNHLRLSEYTKENKQTATIVAVMEAGHLRGSWEVAGKPAIEFDLVRTSTDEFERDSIFDEPIDLLYNAMNEGRWSDAIFPARLLCAREYCELYPQLVLLRDGKPLNTANRNLTRLLHSFELQNAGEVTEAKSSQHAQCERRTYIGYLSCKAYFARLTAMSPEERKEAYRLICETGFGCTDYLGKNEVALIAAAQRGDVDSVAQLLKSRVNVNASAGPLPTALYAAVEHGSLPTIRLLLEHNADSNANRGGVLNLAIIRHRADIALLLLEYGANGSVGLASAIANHEPAIACKILENGTNPNTADTWLSSPLIEAVDNDDIVMTQELLARGADPDFSGKFTSGSAIGHAQKARQKEILKLLLAARQPAEPPLRSIDKAFARLFRSLNCGMTAVEIQRLVRKIAPEADLELREDIIEVRQDGKVVQAQLRSGKVIGSGVAGISPTQVDSFTLCSDARSNQR